MKTLIHIAYGEFGYAKVYAEGDGSFHCVFTTDDYDDAQTPILIAQSLVNGKLNGV